MSASVSDAAALTADAVTDVGEAVILRRVGTPSLDVSCRARVTGYQPMEIQGDIVQGDRRAILSNAEIAASGWPGPPRKGDAVILRGRTTAVQGCNTLLVGDQVVRHELQLRGG